MSDEAAVREVLTRLRSASGFVDVFGKLPDGDSKTKLSSLRRSFAVLAQIVHPDRATNGGQKLATEAFQELNMFWKSAQLAVNNGTYDVSFGSSGKFSGLNTPSIFEIQSTKGSYHLSSDPWRTGDFSVLYRGKLNGGVGTEVIAKISSEPVFNSWLEKEAKALGQFRDAKKGEILFVIRKTVPDLIDTFILAGDGGTRYRVNVMAYRPDFISVAEILKAYPKGLDPTDAGWIARRIIAQTLAASMAGVVHGAIVPDHVLVDPVNREPIHIGWTHSLDYPKTGAGRITHVIDRYRHYYPPEVFDKKAVGHRSDIFMAGKMLIELFGGDARKNALPKSIPDSVRTIILGCVRPTISDRQKNGKVLLEAFTQAIRKEWGRKYRPLEIPIA